jgi:hypothetical protein
MAHQHKARGQRKSYVQRFEQKYKMTRQEWRDLKKEHPQKAQELRSKLTAN